MTDYHAQVETVPITAVVTAYQRMDQTVETLLKIAACRPRPEQILVHVDGGEAECARAIRAEFPSINIVTSEGNVGPGGGRNKLIAAARNDWVASFDDDSYPLDDDYFERIQALARLFPTASILSARYSIVMRLSHPQPGMGSGWLIFQAEHASTAGRHF